MRWALRAAILTLAWLTLFLSAPASADPATAGNGVLGFMSGQGGDRAAGSALYQSRCAACHDHPSGRIPTRGAIADNTQIFIVNTLASGIMKPMAEGLNPLRMNDIAAYLATRQGGTVGSLGTEAPRCAAKPARIALDTDAQWNGWGRDRDQTRFQPAPGLSAGDVPRLKLKWAFAYANSRNGQATVVGDRLFLNASSGAIYALNAQTGCAYWRFDAPALSRGTITVGALPRAPSGYAIYFTDFTKTAYALDADSGALVWKTLVDNQQEVQMTGSPTLADGKLFVPIGSAEEAIADIDTYECCRFRGAIVALDAASGKLLWKTYTVPEAAHPFRKNARGVQMYGPAGGAIWSAPTVDPKRHLVYVGTGDSYTDLGFPNSDAVLALDEETGAIRWSQQVKRDDDYITGCYGFAQPANCPKHPGPDWDFGASPVLRALPDGRTLLLAGQKSGQIYALDPDQGGRVVWQHRIGVGGPLGGIEFGIAADDHAVYVPVSDLYVPEEDAQPSVSALSIADGAVLWTDRLPKRGCGFKAVYCWPGVSQAVSAMPGVVFAGSMDGRFRAFDAKTGKIVWEYDTQGAPVPTVSGRSAQGGVMDAAGPTVAGGMVYVNSGYQARSGRPGTVLMAFSVDGK